MSVISNKKKLILDYLDKFFMTIDPTGFNQKIWHDKIEAMNDKDFDFFMQCLKEEKEILHLYAPNMKVTLKYENIEKAAKLVNIELYQRLKIKDPITGVTYVTPQKYLITETLVRRMQQTVYEKISIPIDDKKVENLTGQVTGGDRACGITYPEIQALKAQGFKEVLTELVTVRGGNLSAYAALKQSLEELGEGDLKNVLDPMSISRSTVMLDVMLTSMGYETNLTERG